MRGLIFPRGVWLARPATCIWLVVSRNTRGYRLCSSAVFQNVDQAPERITDVEACHAPWLSHRTVFDFEPCRLHPPLDVRQVVDLYGEVGYCCSRPALGRHADLRGHTAFCCKGHDPPEVHDNDHPERVTVKGLRGIKLIGCNVCNDANDGRW